MTRKLVTIRTVSEVNPIEGADSIECLTVEGWKVVSQKGNFKPGDLCVYFEIDSALPDGNPLWQDLVDKSSRMFEGKKVHVLRTIKLRGVTSQGFCIPLRKFPEIFAKLGSSITASDEMKQDLINTQIGEIKKQLETIREMDFSVILGVVKYEPPIPAELAGQVKGLFPSKIKKTDQERCQNLAAEIFADLDAKYEVSVKLDGTSMTVYHDPEGLGGVCSRNLEMKVNEENKNNTMVKIGKPIMEVLKQKHPHIAVQGELMGPSIQGNREQLKAPTYFIFDMFNMNDGAYVDPETRANVMQDLNGLAKHVPILHASISLRELGITNIEQLLTFAEGKSLNHDVREGVVFKREDGKFSFKAISNKFLLKQKD
jgi:RNA ligase (TIGR02306 family)